MVARQRLVRQRRALPDDDRAGDGHERDADQELNGQRRRIRAGPGPVTAKLCDLASTSGTTQNQRVGLGSVLADGHTLRRTIRYVIGQRPAIAPGFSLLDVGNHDRKHVPELGGRFAQLRGHWAMLQCRQSGCRRSSRLLRRKLWPVWSELLPPSSVKCAVVARDLLTGQDVS